MCRCILCIREGHWRAPAEAVEGTGELMMKQSSEIIPGTAQEHPDMK